VSYLRRLKAMIVQHPWITGCTILGVIVLGAVASAFTPWAAESDFRSHVSQGSIPSGTVIFEHSAPDWNATDATVVERLKPCSKTSCLMPGKAVVDGCVHVSRTCVAPWTTIEELPAGLLSTPVGGYPSDLQKELSTLTNSPDTVCTGTMKLAVNDPDYFSDSRIVCVNLGQRLLLYRSDE
jgi:hypothetical protein